MKDMFIGQLNEFKDRRLETLRREQAAKEREAQQKQELCADQERKIKFLLRHGQSNIRSLLSEDKPEFTNYMLCLFNKYSVHSSNASVVCGASSGLHVRILILFEEKIHDQTSPEFHMCDVIGPGSGSIDKKQILAFIVYVKGVSNKVSIEQLVHIKLVHLSRTIDSIDTSFYSEAKPVSLDPGFIETLFKLVTPETTYCLLFERFSTVLSKESS